MQQRKRARRVWPFVVASALVAAAVGAALLVPRLMAGQNNQATNTVIGYAMATVGDVQTTVTGSGTLANANTDVVAPVGVVVSEIYVRAGDAVAAGDVLAAVDSSSVAEALALVSDEIAALAETSAALGGSATVERTKAAYEEVLVTLNEIYASGYLQAGVPGTVSGVNVKNGDRITVSAGSSTSSGASSGASSVASSVSTPAALSFSFATDSVLATNSATPANNVVPANSTVSAAYLPTATRAFAVTSAVASEASPLQDGGGNETLKALEDGGETSGPGSEDDKNGDVKYVVSALPYAITTVSRVQEAFSKTATVNGEEAVRVWLTELCEARAWRVDDPTTPALLDIDFGSFTPKKGVYPVTFVAFDDPTIKTITYVVVEDDTAGGGETPGTGSGSSGSSGSTDSGATGGSASGGGSSGGSNTTTSAAGGSVDETVIDSMMSPVFQIQRDNEAEIQIQLDELDVATVKAGQEATVELEALEGQVFTGAVSTVVASNGSYYAVITIEKTEGMYEGFSATATIVKEQVTDVITIPLAAVQQQGGELFVYTTASEDGELGSPSVIETGLSNESTVEVLSGLSEGSTVYYQQQITTGAASTTTNIFGGSGSSAGMPSFGGGSSSGRPSAPSGGPSGSFGGGPPSG